MSGYYFNLPQITELTRDQQAALAETQKIALSGGPGTGKSVVSLWRHIQKTINNKRTFLITYTSTLARYLSACARLQNSNAALRIGKAYSCRYKLQNNHFDEIIIDEAQDLGEDLDFLKGENYYNGFGDNISYGADDSQILYPEHCSTQDDLKQRFPNNIPYTLSKNFRSTQRIMLFAKTCFDEAYIPREIITGLSDNVGEKPVFMVYNNLAKQDNAIIQIIESLRGDTHNIAILVPFKRDVQTFEKLLVNSGYELHTEVSSLTEGDFSVYYEDQKRFKNGCAEIMNIHITTFKSAKGLEFDTVIIPNFHKYSSLCGSYNVEWNDYYVACTRAKSNLYMISNYPMPELNSVVELTIL